MATVVILSLGGTASAMPKRKITKAAEKRRAEQRKLRIRNKARVSDSNRRFSDISVNVHFKQLGAKHHWGLLANGVPIDDTVTIHDSRRDLGLTDDALTAMRHQTALSVAEGVSGLVPFLRQRQIEAYGLDIWYNRLAKLPRLKNARIGNKMRSYVGANGDHLITGDGFAMPQIPNGTFDWVFCRNFADYVLEDERNGIGRFVALHEELLRVASPRGRIVTAFFRPGLKPRLDEALGALRASNEHVVEDIVVSYKGRMFVAETNLYRLTLIKQGQRSLTTR